MHCPEHIFGIDVQVLTSTNSVNLGQITLISIRQLLHRTAAVASSRCVLSDFLKAVRLHDRICLSEKQLQLLDSVHLHQPNSSSSTQ